MAVKIRLAFLHKTFVLCGAKPVKASPCRTRAYRVGFGHVLCAASLWLTYARLTPNLMAIWC